MGFLRARCFQESFRDEVEDLDSVDGMSWKTAESSAKEIMAEFLYTDEVDLGGDGVAFADAFLKQGMKSLKGKSLRDFRLYGRIFKYRCSDMIYSMVFQSLPTLVKSRVIHHLRLALADDSESYLSSREKKVVREILEETVPSFKS
jgi:hypothetical protein